MLSESKPRFLSEREWEAVLAMKSRSRYESTPEAVREWAAKDLGIEKHSLENLLSRIRRKIRESKTFSKKYRKLIKPLR